MNKNYFYVRPDRDNWTPAIEKCRRQLLRELVAGRTLEQAKGRMHTRFRNVSNTYWDEFISEVLDIPAEHAYGYYS